MGKYQAPDGQTGISIGGERFNADANGIISVPDGDYHSLLIASGYTQVVEIEAEMQPENPVVEIPKRQDETEQTEP